MYEYTYIHIYTQWNICVYMPHLICSFVYVYLYCFHILAIVNNVAMNIGVAMSIFSNECLWGFLDLYPEAKLLDHMVVF